MARLIALLACTIASQAFAEDTDPQRYAIDPDESWVRIQVFRGGLLAGIGHNHVVSVGSLNGTIELAEDINDSALHLTFPVRSLQVDQPEDREAEGERFNGKISDKNIIATSDNMLGDELLQADTYPLIEIHSNSIAGSMPDVVVHADVTVRTHTAKLEFPAKLQINDDQIVAIGSLPVSQGDLDLPRFKAALGTLRVKDELLLHYRIVANSRN